MVEARTPRISGFCCSSTNSSSSAEGVRANTSSLTASSEPLRTWKRAFSGRGGSLSLRIASRNSCSSSSLSRLTSMTVR